MAKKPIPLSSADVKSGAFVDPETGKPSAVNPSVLEQIERVQREMEEEKRAKEEAEAAASKKSLPKTKSEGPKEDGERGDEDENLREAAKKEKLFSKSFPSLSKFLEHIDHQIGENRKQNDRLDRDMQAVGQTLNETNNLLSTLNSYMYRSLGVLGSILSSLKSSGGDGSGGGGGAGGGKGTWGATVIGAILGVAAAAAPDVYKYLPGDDGTDAGLVPGGDTDDPASIVPTLPESETPPVKTSDATSVSTPDLIQTVSYEQTDDLDRQMQATQDYLEISQKMTDKFANMSADEQSSTDMGGALSALESSVKSKYGVSSFSKNMADYNKPSASRLPTALSTVSLNRTNNTENKQSDAIKNLDRSTKGSEKSKNLTLNADKITFNAENIEFNQEDEAPDGSEGGPDLGASGSYKGGLGPPGFNDFTPTVKPELSSIKTMSGKSVQVAKQYADRFQGFINDLEAGGYKINDIGGYANRMNVNNPSVPSMHAYGAAIDINPSDNPNNSTTTNLPPETAELASKWGLGWGMNWRSVKDPMHFSAAPKEGGTGDMAPSAVASATPQSTIASAAPPSGAPGSIIPQQPASGKNMAFAAAMASVAAKSSPPSETVVTNNFPAKPSPSSGQPEKLRDPRRAGNVEPSDAEFRFSAAFGMGRPPEHSGAR